MKTLEREQKSNLAPPPGKKVRKHGCRVSHALRTAVPSDPSPRDPPGGLALSAQGDSWAQGRGLPFRLSSAASESDSSPGPASLLPGEESLPRRSIEADFGEVPVMESSAVRAAVSPEV